MNTPNVLLPVYNGQRHLEGDVVEILEVLAELACPFELVILDDGSTDETPELARELAARFPQIRVIRHPVRLGLAEAIQTALDHSRGTIVLVGDEDYCLDPDDLQTLWKLRDTGWHDSRQTALHAEPWMNKLLAWQSRTPNSRRGFQRVSRTAFEQFRLNQATEAFGRVDGAETTSLVLARRFAQPKFLHTTGQLTPES